MTIENQLSEPPSSLKPFPSTTPRRLNLKYGIRQAKKDTSLLHRCIIGTQIVQSSFMISHKLYVLYDKPAGVLIKT